jgi:hypothetical protein
MRQNVYKTLLLFSALKWPVMVAPEQQQMATSQFASTKVKEQQKQDEALLQVLNFDQIEIEFRSRVWSFLLLVFSLSFFYFLNV